MNIQILKNWILPFSAILALFFIAFLLRSPFYVFLVPAAFILYILFKNLSLDARHIWWFMWLCLPMSGEWQVTTSLGLDMPMEPLLIILTGVGILSWLYRPSLFPNHFMQSVVGTLLLIHVAWLGLQLLFSSTPLLSLKYLLAKIWYIFPFVLMLPVWLEDNSFWKKLVVFSVAAMLLGVIQTLIRHAAYGFEFDALENIFHPFYRNHVTYSAILIVVMAILFANYWMTDNKKVRKISLGIGLLFLIALYFSFSRGAWLAGLLGMASIFIFLKRWWVQVMVLTAIALASISIWITQDQRWHFLRPAYDQTIYHTDFDAHMQATFALKDVSNAERIHRWIAGARMITERPMVGFGPNSFYENYRYYTNPLFRTWVSDNPEKSTVHNYYLLVAVEQGIIGWLIWMAMIVTVLLRLQFFIQHEKDKMYRVIWLTTGAVFVMILALNLINDLIETDKVGGVFWVCIGLVIWGEKRIRAFQNAASN
ncbi:MAG: O-antigen ligase family protein [Hydrotalea sp.]|nr:O-antigen ligase family protein [Hydrotalea sp.]